ncbi:MAG TPA: DUF6644 family protein, partial [Vicinamibacterales bacterium]|nr:DUF6644 family protein [Vicinamibacterales bacterium]
MFEFAEWLGSTPLSVAIQSRLWLTPLLQSIHIVMIGIVFVSILTVALRVLGRIRTDQPLAEVWRLCAPWFWSSLGVMAGTGLILSIGEPVRQATAMSFWVKMTLLAIGVASAVWFGRKVAATAGGVEPVSSRGARIAAVVTILLWLAI